ncbi:DsbA family protein [Streptomyces sp. NPDC059070]|uniref:DsbA family protein n=1 Tax=unclassified Streptomyces TaxID=2593676 RepID=UPI0034E250F0
MTTGRTPVRRSTGGPGRGMRRGVLALAVAGALGASAVACSSGSSGGSGADSGGSDAADLVVKTSPHAARLAKLPAKAEGAEIVVGSPSAPHTVQVYEDPRCPYCAKFESSGAVALNDLAARGKVKIRYTVASFLDRNLGGGGSARAAGALRAAVDAGRFAEYHAAVFASQPEDEATDGYTADNLLRIADKVSGLRGAAFDRAVREDTYKSWVKSAEKAFEDSGVNSSPTVLIDGKRPPGDGSAILDADAFAKVLKDAGIS